MSRFISAITAALLGLAWLGLLSATMPPDAFGGMLILTIIAGIMAVLTLRRPP